MQQVVAMLEEGIKSRRTEKFGTISSVTDHFLLHELEIEQVR